MKHELPYFYIGSAYGGNQDWLTDRMMNLGGCAAVTACDSSIYFTRYKDAQGSIPTRPKTSPRRTTSPLPMS